MPPAANDGPSSRSTSDEHERLLRACFKALLADDVATAEEIFDECVRRAQRETALSLGFTPLPFKPKLRFVVE